MKQEIYRLTMSDLEKIESGELVSIITKDHNEVIIMRDKEEDIDDQIARQERIANLVADIQDEERD